MIEVISLPAKLCTCERCLTEWISVTVRPPQRCRNQACRTREWNGKTQQLQKSHAQEIKLPAPRSPGRPRTSASFDWSEDSDS